jgi:hypothetical protein
MRYVFYKKILDFHWSEDIEEANTLFVGDYLQLDDRGQ